MLNLDWDFIAKSGLWVIGAYSFYIAVKLFLLMIAPDRGDYER